MTTRRIAIVAGGFSSEFPVSMKSAEGIKTFLENTMYVIHPLKDDTYVRIG